MPITQDIDLPASIAFESPTVPSLNLADRIDVSNTDQLAALYQGREVTREALQAVVDALQPVLQDVHFYAMR